MPSEIPIPETKMRRGLIENAGGQLKCPICRELLREALMVSVDTGTTDAMVLPQESRVYVKTTITTRPTGIYGVVVGLSCNHDHHVFLSLVVDDGYATVKTEWEVPERGGRDAD